MPNHVFNVLKVSGPKQEVNRFILHAEGLYPWDTANKLELLSCASFIPPPKDAIENYGEIGYHWAVANWGTKWGCYDIDRHIGKRSVLYIFQSAWSPPVPVIYRMVMNFPKLRFSLHYREGAMGFQGWVKGYKGQITMNKDAEYRGCYGG